MWVRVGVLGVAAAAACETRDGGGPNGVTALTRETHARFPLGPETAHGAADCNDCHGAFDSFAEFDCLGCHEHAQDRTDPVHASMTDYAYDSARCYECHPTGGAGSYSREGHTPFPVQVGTDHGDVACSACHVQSSDWKVVDCATCHATETPSWTTAHTGVRDYVAGDSRLCMRCHPVADVPITVLAHNANEFRMAGPHVRCLDCHDALLSAPPFPAADFETYDCEGACHEHTRARMDNKHQGEPDYGFDLCLQCHPDGSKE